MNELITLVGADGSKRDVFCGLRSITQTEFYAANATDFRPEKKFVLADALDYNDEPYVLHNGGCFRVLRTYSAGQELELVVERASAEEAELYG